MYDRRWAGRKSDRTGKAAGKGDMPPNTGGIDDFCRGYVDRVGATDDASAIQS